MGTDQWGLCLALHMTVNPEVTVCSFSFFCIIFSIIITIRNALLNLFLPVSEVVPDD